MSNVFAQQLEFKGSRFYLYAISLLNMAAFYCLLQSALAWPMILLISLLLLTQFWLAYRQGCPYPRLIGLCQSQGLFSLQFKDKSPISDLKLQCLFHCPFFLLLYFHKQGYRKQLILFCDQLAEQDRRLLMVLSRISL